MRDRKLQKKRKSQGTSVIPQDSRGGAASSSCLSEAETSAGSDLDKGPVCVPARASSFVVYTTRNYIASTIYHAYIAFLPALLLPILNNSPAISRWSANSVTLLTVFIANSSWLELFGWSCTGDACAAFISLTQEKQFHKIGATHHTGTTKWRCLLGGFSGFLGALTVGLMTAFFSPLNPFGSVRPLSQELFLRIQKQAAESGSAATEASLLADTLSILLTEEQRNVVASLLQAAAVATVGQCPKFLMPLLYGMQDTLLSVQPWAVLRATSLLFDIFLAEFFCCFTFHLVTAVVTTAGFFFDLKHAERIKLMVLLVAAAAGLPFCAVVGGPMLGVSYAALVAGARLDPWCFALAGSADWLAALCATRLVQPLPLVLSEVRARERCSKKKAH
ncbi:uncharacterized protein LOC113146885 [Cyclospora cayetanensis]|uniref:Uncharacterized protein LOC113146885 n=1 Tax=Cyclospora cayetanensis TaxID=88456 RepID=A0A6P6RW32_9EIME|nr:uncharacterized protein LOC113146885 [Cyclospora cayetanensis]